MKPSHIGVLAASAAALTGASAVVAQNYATYLGNVETILPSLSATRSVQDSKVIPAPPPEFAGRIEKNVSQSLAWWPPAIRPKAGTPNVLLVLIDDEGFGAPSTTGGLIPTPELDRLAKDGITYVNFHTTALCSPTRAALLTGRNHHSVGFGTISEISTGFPGYDALIPKDKATIGRVLQANGYATAWFGKDHNVPTWQTTSNGPFDQWPAAQGFDKFYGFFGGDTSQWHPTVWDNRTQIHPDVGHPGYNLNVDLADQAIKWIDTTSTLNPEQPIFVFYAPGAVHAPHHALPEWIAKFDGKFDYGWNEYQRRVFERQKRLGVIPPAAKLPEWPDFLPKWETLSPVQKKVYSKQLAVYAAYLAETDYEIGRVVQALKDNGKYDNTLIVYISGDNGASAEGTLKGTSSEFLSLQGQSPPLEQEEKLLPEWGGPKTYPHYAVPWAFALDTPFRWTKQVAQYFGGTKNSAVVVWPNRIKDKGSLRFQFHHVIDVAPTILEAAGITPPEEVDGVKQSPLQGVSFAYTFDKANRDVPTTHTTQYFEQLGGVGLYHDGWFLAADPFKPPWLIGVNPGIVKPWDDAVWRLYDVRPEADWTQTTDLAPKYPEKVEELKRLFVAEGEKYNVFPIDTRHYVLNARPSLTAGRDTLVYRPGIEDLANADAPQVIGKSFTVTADIVVPETGANGVIVSEGGQFGGYALWLDDGKPVFTYNLLGLLSRPWEGAQRLAPGSHKIVFAFKYEGPGLGKPGDGTLLTDGKLVADGRIDKTVPLLWPWDDGFTIGADNGTPVDARYSVPNAFTGTIEKVTFHFPPDGESAAERQKRLEATARASLTAAAMRE
jgi:arylsulfatase